MPHVEQSRKVRTQRTWKMCLSNILGEELPDAAIGGDTLRYASRQRQLRGAAQRVDPNCQIR